MPSMLPLLAFLLPALCTGQDVIPPIACQTHSDCSTGILALRSGSPLRGLFAVCEHGVCVLLSPADSCKGHGFECLPARATCDSTSGCQQWRSCRNGRCALGGLGAACHFPLGEECMPGFACDMETKTCVRGVSGVSCIDDHHCGFGHFCLTGGNASGVCKIGFEGASCSTNKNCAGPLRCMGQGRPGRCSRPIYHPSSSAPETFRACENSSNCRSGQVCINSTCRPKNLGLPCGQGYRSFYCGSYSTCQKGKCTLTKAGSTCSSTREGLLNDECVSGTSCNAPRDQGRGRPGKCVVGREGTSCQDGEHCMKGLLCGSSKTCVKSAEGQRCRSNFWCPKGYLCSKKTSVCTAGIVDPDARHSEDMRSKKCSSVADCPEGRCINGVCLPPTLGWACNPREHTFGTICEGGVLVEGTEGKPCSSAGDCFLGKTCRSGFCAVSKLGDHCLKTAHCTPPMRCNHEDVFGG